MKLGYMTNAFGPLVGEGGGVTSIKDIRYLTLCDDEAVLKKITNAGFRYIEVLEGNLTKYGSDIQVLKDMLAPVSYTHLRSRTLPLRRLLPPGPG